MKDYDIRCCVICGAQFKPKRINQVTCASAECRDANKHYLQRRWHKENRGSTLEANRRYMRERRHEEYQPKPDTIIAIGYAERQMADSLRKAGKVRTEL